MALDEHANTPALNETAAASSPASGRARRRLVDADAHLDPPHQMWKDYLPAHLRDQAPYIEEGEQHDWVVFEGNKRPLRMIGNQAGRTGKDFKMTGRLSDMRTAWLPETRLADMDTDGIDAAVVFGGGPLGTTSTELYIASFEAYNRWLADFVKADPKRMVGVAYLPMRDVEETVRLLREASRLGHRTVNIPAFPQSADGITSSARVAAISTGQGAALTGNPSTEKTYNDPEFVPFWDEVTALDMTVTMHLGGRSPRFGEKKHFLPDMLMSKFSMGEPAAIMIFGGLFAKYPNLRLALVESGVGWFAFAAEYMDRTWEKQRYWTESTLTEKPSFYMDRNIYGSFINDRIGVLQRNEPGGRNIMWSSDYPHSETSFPNSHKVIERDFVGVPEADINQIVCERARKLYSVP